MDEDGSALDIENTPMVKFTLPRGYMAKVKLDFRFIEDFIRHGQQYEVAVFVDDRVNDMKCKEEDFAGVPCPPWDIGDGVNRKTMRSNRTSCSRKSARSPPRRWNFRTGSKATACQAPPITTSKTPPWERTCGSVGCTSSTSEVWMTSRSASRFACFTAFTKTPLGAASWTQCASTPSTPSEAVKTQKLLPRHPREQRLADSSQCFMPRTVSALNRGRLFDVFGNVRISFLSLRLSQDNDGLQQHLHERVEAICQARGIRGAGRSPNSRGRR